jgi:hypothetical protein
VPPFSRRAGTATTVVARRRRRKATADFIAMKKAVL